MIEFLTATQQRVLLLQIVVLSLSAAAAGFSFFDSLHAFIATICLVTLGLLSLKAAFYAVNQSTVSHAQTTINHQQTESAHSELAGMRSELAELTAIHQQQTESARSELARMRSEVAELSGHLNTINSQLLELAESRARNEAADRDRAIVEKLPVQVAKIEQDVTWLLDNIETMGRARDS